MMGEGREQALCEGELHAKMDQGNRASSKCYPSPAVVEVAPKLEFEIDAKQRGSFLPRTLEVTPRCAQGRSR